MHDSIHTIIERFEIFCDEPVSVEVNSRGYYNISINGKSLVDKFFFNGNLYREINLPKCQTHTLKIDFFSHENEIENGIVYQLVQNEDCINCPINSYFST